MKNLNFCIGLPRSGSTLLMNILQQNPSIYTTGTCPMPYMLDAANIQANTISEFVAMDQNTVSSGLKEFLIHGFEGWFNSLTDKPNVISKSRAWDMHLNTLFRIYDNPKFIVCLRDIRDIICSLEKLLHKNTHIKIGSDEDPMHLMPLDKRIELYCTDGGANLGRPLHILKNHISEWMHKRPYNFFLFRWEDFNENPTHSLSLLYKWLELPEYQHDLNNIPQAEQIEHDHVYRALVDHKTRPKLEYLKPSWPTMLSEHQSQVIINNLHWYYEKYYPEMLK